MSESSHRFREQLLAAQKTTPHLYDAYQREMDAIVHPPMTVRSALPGVVLLVILVVCAALIVRAAIFHFPGPLLATGYAILAAACVWAAAMIIRDLRRRRHSHTATSSVAGALTASGGVLTVIALLMGLHNPSDPKSLFGAFYVFVFYFACAIWALENRIKSAELASRESNLRIEYRLADLAERLPRA